MNSEENFDKAEESNINSKENNIEPSIFELQTIRIEEFQAVIDAYKKILILTHDYPDPDAIASAFGLYKLLTEKYNKDVRIGHGGIIGRTENKLMVLKLNIPLYSTKLIGDLHVFEGAILVDTHPESKNSPLSENNEKLPIIAVFDHHPKSSKESLSTFEEIRPEIGSTSAIITHYLERLEFPIDQDLATALFYGIKTDTLEFSRHASKWDIDAHQYLFPLINYEILSKIEKPELPREYYLDMLKALENAEIYGTVVIVEMGDLQNPDMLSLIADLMLQYEHSDWAIVYGIYESEIRISIRNISKTGHAGKLIKQIVKKRGGGGGHQEMAGAQIKFKYADKDVEYTVIKQIIIDTIFSELKLPTHGSKLCQPKKNIKASKDIKASTESYNK